MNETAEKKKKSFLLPVLFLLAVIAAAAVWLLRKPTEDLEPYSEASLDAALTELWQSGSQSGEFVYAAGKNDVSAVSHDVENFFQHCSEEDLRFGFEVEDWGVNVKTESGKIIISPSLCYADKGAYSDLPRFITLEDAFDTLAKRLKNEDAKVWFLVDQAWTTDTLDALAGELNLNDVYTAAEWSSFSRFLSSVENDGFRLAYLEKDYDIDSQELADCTEALRGKVLEIADGIRSRGITDPHELYLAAAKAVAELASYDDNTRASTLTANLTDEEKIDRSAYGALVSCRTVCSGYTYAFKAVCDELGLFCRCVTGSNRGDSHMWNLIDGRLYMDCTFYDTARSEKYLFMDESDLAAYQYILSEDTPLS